MLKTEIQEYIATCSGKVAVYLKDMTTGTVVAINEKETFPSASTIKLVIMAQLLEEVLQGKRSLDDKIIITKDMLTGGDGVLKEMELGHSFTLKEILTFMIIVSDNMATNILIDMLGMDAVNAQGKKLGLEKATLGRKMMDSQARKLGHDNYICAQDMAMVLEKIYTGKLVNEEMSAVALDILKRQQQMGRLQLYLPEELVVAHKCGDLDFLEHDGGIFFMEGKPYILVVLTAQAKTNKDARETIGNISKIVYDSYRKASI